MTKLIRPGIAVLTFACATASLLATQTEQERAAIIKKQIQQAEVFDFGKVRSDAPVEHTFQLRNSGLEPLEVKTVQLTPPLKVTGMRRLVKPGETTAITVSLGQPRTPGDFEGIIVVHFTKEDATDSFFRVQGRIVRSIDFEPMPAFFVTAFKGESKQQSVEITNYESEPLRILKVEHDNARFTTDLTTLDAGRRYQLTVQTKDSAPAGKAEEILRLVTSSKQHPVIQIPVHTQVRNRVYTFPDSITLGLIDSQALKSKPQELAFLSQSVMVYQRNGTDFQITTETDVPFLRLTKRQDRIKDRYEVQIEVIPEKLKAGRFNGSIRIKTNDVAFPLLEIPVISQVNEDW